VGVDPSSTVPAAFIGHGSPMNALEANVWTAAWREFGASLPALRGVVAISAHWYVGATAVTAMDHPRTIHDFTGFPPELFAMQYPAPGDPGLAGEVADLLAPTDVVADTAAWGLDHGTWSVLCHVLPDASVPVVQLSIDSSASWDDHVRMGSRLEPLRHDGVLIIGSGNVVHNLGRMDWGRPTGAFDWATRVDEAVRTAATRTPIDIEALGAIPATPDGALAVPTDEHYLPLAYLAGLATAARAPLRTLTGGVAFGSVSMASFVLD
jgi:4,5-DOPA dioxygenase extradiol